MVTSPHTRMAAQELTLLCQPPSQVQHNRLRVLAPCPCASTPRRGLARIQSAHPSAGRPQHSCQEYGGQPIVVKDKGDMFRVRDLIGPVSGLRSIYVDGADAVRSGSER